MDVLPIVVPPIGETCYLLSDPSGACAVVDPGGSPQAVLAAAGERSLSMQAIFLTHGHFDHVGAVEALAGAAGGIPVYLHPLDRALWGRGGPTGFGTDLFPPFSFSTLDYGEGDLLSVGELTVKVLHTPGHTPGSVCLMTEVVIFTGDTLFRLSAGRTDLPGGDPAALAASLRRLGALEGEYRLFPGHGEETCLSREKAENPFLSHAREGRG